MLGLLLMGLSFISFGLSSYIENKSLFITMQLITRFVQGLSSGILSTTMYSIAMNFFPENREAMSGYVESAGSCGLVTGPLIGTVLYAIGGYQFIF